MRVHEYLRVVHSRPRRGQPFYVQFLRLLSRMPKIIVSLHIHPAFGGGVGRHRDAQRHLRTDAGMTVSKLGERLSGDPKALRTFGHRDPAWFEIEATENLTWVRRVVHFKLPFVSGSQHNQPPKHRLSRNER